MQNKMLFKTWTLDDVDELEMLEQNIFPTDSWSRQAIIDGVHSPAFHAFLMKEESGNTVGYYGLYIIPPEGYIANIAVCQTERGKGYGDMLMEHMHEYGKKLGLTAFTLEVRKSNEVAKSLYVKYGYEYGGTRKGYYEDGEDALIYWKYIDN